MLDMEQSRDFWRDKANRLEERVALDEGRVDRRLEEQRLRQNAVIEELVRQRDELAASRDGFKASAEDYRAEAQGYLEERDHWKAEVLKVEGHRQRADSALTRRNLELQSLQERFEGLQDDTQRAEERLGRALIRLRAFVQADRHDTGYDAKNVRMSNGEWRDYVRDVLEDDEWDDKPELLENAFKALRALYNWDRQDHQGLSHVVRQAAYQAVMQFRVWDDLRQWDRAQWDRMRGGDEDGQRQAGAASEPTPEAETGPESADREDAARPGRPDGRPAGGAVEPDFAYERGDAGADEAPDPGPFSPPGYPAD